MMENRKFEKERDNIGNKQGPRGPQKLSSLKSHKTQPPPPYNHRNVP